MKFLEGTYGVDLLSLFLILISCIFNIWDITRVFSIILLVFAFYRAFSKKIYKRREEYNVFYTYTNKLLSKFGKSIPYNLPVYNLNNLSKVFENFNHWLNEKKNYKITKCPNCKQKLRLPRGKGNIVVTCKKCSTKFDFRT
ncbi:Uncharacterised protein [uncultured Clostridium sp.]|uniref:hypothetical protein n=1 Tax=uncultured Clostridium sp. TaxID=59620 RepID=UPI0008219FA1|nr:hypothetical protein [uncultured Clostridium sp.]SCJ47803.1 Uncharacterised protein [uncultured Clostridium sp.]